MNTPESTDARPADSRAAILAAATEEFLAHGLNGVRMEHVAKRAGYNKALVYRHFKTRERLFEAVLENAFAGRRAVLEREPAPLGDALAAWTDAAFDAPAYGRLLMREALDRPDVEPVLADERAAFYRRQVEGVAKAQALGRLPPDIPPKYLFLALLSVVCLPAFLPNVTALATGEDPTSPEFQEAWRRALAEFAKALGAEGQANADDV